MRISDWSSDVCSSDLKERLAANPDAYEPDVLAKIKWRISITGKSLETLVPRGVRIAFGTGAGVSKHGRTGDEFDLMVQQLGRASCRARVCQYVWLSVVAVSLKRKKKNIPVGIR